MDKSQNPTISRLKQPTMLPLPKSRAVLQSINRNKIHEDPGYIRPAKRMMSRRSKSFSDLQTIMKPKEQCFKKIGMPTISKPLLSSISTSDLRNKGKNPTLNSALRPLPQPLKLTKPIYSVLKSIPETSKVIKPGTSTVKATLKRPAVTSSEDIVKPKVSKPAKPAPYDYKARYNLLNEKHTSLVQTNKDIKEKLLNAEKKLDTFATLEETYSKLKVDYDFITNECNQLQKSHADDLENLHKWESKFDKLNKEHENLSNECHKQKKEDLRNKNIIRMLQADNVNLKTSLTTLKSELETLQDEYKALNDNHQKLSQDHECIKQERDKLSVALNNVKTTNESLQCELQNCKTFIQSHEESRRAMHNQIQDLKGTIRVFCRVRPSKPQENDKILCSMSFIDENTLEIKRSKESINVISGKANDLKLEFNFDKVFPPEASQLEVFEDLAQLVQSALDGYHVCVFAYGQTGSGKTYTMQGEEDQKYVGMIPRTIDRIFALISNLAKVGWNYSVEVSFLEIYNENIKDLLDKNNKEQLDIRFNEGKGTTVTNLSVREVQSAEELKQLMEQANKNRAVAATNFNEHSSRSHAVTKITLMGVNEDSQISYRGSLSLVDLAGSESAKTSDRLTETKNINKSLSNLGTVMSSLHNNEGHIPYRNSKLTYLLQSSLGGNSKTLMFVNVAPFEECYNESVNALRFAAKVKEVKIGSKRNKTYLQREMSNLS